MRTQGVVGASIVELCAQGATLSFRCVMVRLGIVQMGKGGWGLVGWKSLALGMGPIDLSVFVAQLKCMCSHGTGLAAMLAMGDGVGCMVPLLGSCTP